MLIEPFEVKIHDDVLIDLKRRIRSSRWATSLPDVGWNQGTNGAYLKDLMLYWSEQYDWRRIEKKINSYPNFRADVDGTAIHFIHQKAAEGKGIPIILSHGWPSSFIEYLPVIDRLTDPKKFGLTGPSFDVVIPSLPGYGFSERPLDRPVDYKCTAELWHSLMRGLGYQRFSAGGGDFGAGINTFLALGHPESLERLYVSFLEAIPYCGPGSRPLSNAEQNFLHRMDAWTSTEHGYLEIESTKPQTLGVALTDSPAGLASWIVEKWRGWGDCKGDVNAKFGKDIILDNITIYWVTNSITTSMLDYYDNRPYLKKQPGFAVGLNDFVRVPTAFSCWPFGLGKEANSIPPKEWVERLYNIVYWSEMNSGGHFSALEEPDMFAQDLMNFFSVDLGPVSVC